MRIKALIFSRVTQKIFLKQVTLLASALYSEKVLSNSKSLASIPTKEVDQHKLHEAVQLAKKELRKANVKNLVCAALKSASTNIRDVAKIVGAALLPLSIAGTISLPITPLFYAAAALIVFDIGVNTYCRKRISDE